MYSLMKSFTFSAAHRLMGLPDGHPCGRLHGHNYEVQLIVESPILDQRGFAGIDYRELDAVRDRILDLFEHKTILYEHDPIRTHETADFGYFDKSIILIDSNPTAENLARLIWTEGHKLVPQLRAVRVSETGRTSAEYRPPWTT